MKKCLTKTLQITSQTPVSRTPGLLDYDRYVDTDITPQLNRSPRFFSFYSVTSVHFWTKRSITFSDLNEFLNFKSSNYMRSTVLTAGEIKLQNARVISVVY